MGTITSPRTLQRCIGPNIQDGVQSRVRPLIWEAGGTAFSKSTKAFQGDMAHVILTHYVQCTFQ